MAQKKKNPAAAAKQAVLDLCFEAKCEAMERHSLSYARACSVLEKYGGTIEKDRLTLRCAHCNGVLRVDGYVLSGEISQCPTLKAIFREWQTSRE